MEYSVKCRDCRILNGWDVLKLHKFHMVLPQLLLIMLSLSHFSIFLASLDILTLTLITGISIVGTIITIGHVPLFFLCKPIILRSNPQHEFLSLFLLGRNLPDFCPVLINIGNIDVWEFLCPQR